MIVTAIIVIPMIHSIIQGLLARSIGRAGATYIIIVNSVLLIIASIILFYQTILCETTTSLFINTWYKNYIIDVKNILIVDATSSVMVLVISIVSSLVIIYSIGYLSSSHHINRFYSYLSMFTCLMLVLVTTNNFLAMFIGWEGIGLMSYLLISYWTTRQNANKNALKAVIVNKVGDMAFLMAAALIANIFATLDYNVIKVMVPAMTTIEINIFDYTINALYLIGIFIILAAIVKSAQIGLHIWLPDAMEAPTPVSALLHAATMVTAGIFVLLRSVSILDISSSLLSTITLLGSITAVIAGSIGLFQSDIKKIIAYSTCSQLGYMFMSYGLRYYDVTLFHLFNHAFFKAALFLSSGNIIHSVNNIQDIRRYGSLRLPITYAVILISSLSLMGFSFLAGYYSKDVIIELAFTISTSWALVAYILSICASIITGLYSFKIIYYTFVTTPNSRYHDYIKHHEAIGYMIVPIVILAIFAIFSGYLFKEIFLGAGVNTLQQITLEYHLLDIEHINTVIKLLPIILATIASIIYYTRVNKKTISNIKLVSLITLRYNIDILIYRSTILLGNKLAYNITWKTLDKGAFNLINNLNSITMKLSKKVENMQNQIIGEKITTMLVIALILLATVIY